MIKVLFVCMTLLLHSICLASGSTETSTVINAESPQEIIHYYCDNWISGDYQMMFGSLSEPLQTDTEYEDFKSKKISDQEKVGLPEKCVIEDKLIDVGNKSLWSVRIKYSNNVVGEIVVKNWCVKSGKTWKLSEGGLVGGISRTPFY